MTAGAPKGNAGARVTRLILENFRSYASLDLSLSRPLVALVGENGAGKTNLLEALSLFSPGRGLRRSEFAQMARHGAAGFSVSVALGEEGHRLGTGIAAAGESRGRLCRVDGAPAGSPVAFGEFLRLVWLTPDSDGLFRGSAGERRRFLDRFVLAVDGDHAARTSALERALRTRNRLLEERPDDGRWLDAVEREVAEIGTAVAAARAETVARLSALIAETRNDASAFPFAEIALAGEIDDLVASLPALEAEERFRDHLRAGRPRDRAAGRTLVGPQASDLLVRHGPKNLAAGEASTGEQKALLIGLVLAQARLVARMNGIAPLVLLDEVAAHLDPRRREALYEELGALASQVFMTGADPALFAALGTAADLVEVTPGAARLI